MAKSKSGSVVAHQCGGQFVYEIEGEGPLVITGAKSEHCGQLARTATQWSTEDVLVRVRQRRWAPFTEEIEGDLDLNFRYADEAYLAPIRALKDAAWAAQLATWAKAAEEKAAKAAAPAAKPAAKAAKAAPAKGGTVSADELPDEVKAAFAAAGVKF